MREKEKKEKKLSKWKEKRKTGGKLPGASTNIFWYGEAYIPLEPFLMTQIYIFGNEKYVLTDRLVNIDCGQLKR